MSERYARLYALPENLYAVGSPVVIAAGALLKDHQTGKVLAQLKFRSISGKHIKAVTVSLQPLDTVGSSLGDSILYQHLDLDAARNGEFGTKVPILLPDPATRSYTASMVKVFFADNTLWTASSATWEALPCPAALESTLADPELVKQYRIKLGDSCQYTPIVHKDLWYCT